MRTVPFLLALIMAMPAFARGPSGELDQLITPNEGRCALVAPGESFEVVAKQEGGITLVGDATYALESSWGEADGFQHATCIVGDDVAPGVYAIELATADGTDRTERSVYVVKDVPETYVAVHITDLHLGSTSNGRPVTDIAAELAATLSASPIQLVLVTGEITADGTSGQYKEAISFLTSLEKPAIVCPGEGDGAAFERYFGPVPFAARVGQDNFLALDSRVQPVGANETYQSGAAARMRDRIKPGRWSIGLTHYYGPRWDPRFTIALFADDALDHLFAGYYHRENRAGEKRVIWGTTPLTMTPAASDGAVRFVEIGARGIRPEAPRFLVKTE